MNHKHAIKLRRVAAEEQKQFARIFGRRPCLSNPGLWTTDTLQLFTETFGPPEVLNWHPKRVLYWTFCDQNGKGGYTLFTQIPRRTLPQTVELILSTRKNKHAFVDWIIRRIGEVSNCVAPPLGIGGQQFCVTSLRQAAR